MDEPFAALDPVNRGVIQDEFLRMQQALRKTILFVSHDIDEAVKMANRIAIFRSGKLVQFAPPDGTRPGEIGTLVDEKADPVDVTATLVDLAVRGYLRIEEVPRSNPKKKPKDWTLVQLKDPDGTELEFEATLLRSLFAGRQQVKLSELQTTFASSMATVQTGLYRHVTENGWFLANPRTVRNAWRTAGVALVAIGASVVLYFKPQ